MVSTSKTKAKNNQHLSRLKKWVAALRSGKYKQATGSLHVTGFLHATAGYCCIGVGECLIPAKFKVKAFHYSRIRDYYGYDEQTEGRLIGMNDNENRNFGYIAKYIEKTMIAPLSKL